jgi:cation diffusion facilitator CzcD-associated flavoprotein CzcO
MSDDPCTLVIGGGPAGLAVAACLQQAGLRPCVLEKGQAVGTSWRSHYRRLHLHTVKELSALPGLAFPAEAPRYVPRAQVVDYLEAYARHFALQVQTSCEVVSVARPAERVEGAEGAEGAEGWEVCARVANGGSELRRWQVRRVVLASGANAQPRRPALPGEEVFGGRVLHSRSYTDARAFAGQRVLVVGMGNTGAEIALDLCEQGVAVGLSVRSPVNIVHREFLGRPSQRSSLLLARLPQRWGDTVAGWLRDLSVGDLSAYGLRTPVGSPLAQLREEGRTPVIDVGTVAQIRAGRIAVYPGIDQLVPGGVRFVDGRQAAFDTVLLATGYGAGLQALFPTLKLPLDERGLPTSAIGAGELAGLCFVGFDLRQPGGLLRTIAQQAQAVARHLAQAG